MTNRKINARNNIGQMDAEEKRALGTFQRDLQRGMPQMQQLAAAAKRLHQAMIDAPTWQLMETPKPEDAEEPKMWSVGHAQVNYVDEIKTEGAQDK